MEYRIIAKNIPNTVELTNHHDVIEFHIIKLRKLQEKILKTDFSLNCLSITNNGMKATNIKKTIPLTGHDSPKSNPEKRLSIKYFLFKSIELIIFYKLIKTHF